MRRTGHQPETPLRRAQLFGLPIDLLDMDETVARCRELIDAARPAQHVVINASKVVLLRDEPRLLGVIGGCDLVSADGMSVVWAGRLLGLRVPERVAGIDLMGRLIELAESRGWPVYFLGARSQVLGRFLQVVQQRHPRLIVAGARDGYFSDDRAVAEAVAGSGARLLFVAISSPRKELFLAEQLTRMGPVFAMGVGGSFDVWAGHTRRAPTWMQRTGLEWLHRLAQEPRRMAWRYVIGNTRFAWMVLLALARRREGVPSC